MCKRIEPKKYIQKSSFTIYKMKTWLILIAVLIGLLPILLAAIVSFRNNVSIFNEGTGGGAYLLFLLITIPIALIVTIVGLFV